MRRQPDRCRDGSSPSSSRLSWWGWADSASASMPWRRRQRRRRAPRAQPGDRGHGCSGTPRRRRTRRSPRSPRRYRSHGCARNRCIRFDRRGHDGDLGTESSGRYGARGPDGVPRWEDSHEWERSGRRTWRRRPKRGPPLVVSAEQQSVADGGHGHRTARRRALHEYEAVCRVWSGIRACLPEDDNDDHNNDDDTHLTTRGTDGPGSRRVGSAPF